MRKMIVTAPFVLLLAAPASAGTVCPQQNGGLGACGAGSFGAGPSDIIVDGVTFRSYDGSGNNIANQDWGAAGTEFLRRGTVERDADGFTRSSGPDARDVSNSIGATRGTGTTDPNGLSNMFWAWGQFIDHDVTLTEESHTNMALGTGLTDVTRSTGVGGEQINQISAYIDASAVYGSDAQTASNLRTNDGSGRLRMGADGNLPTDADGNFLAGDIRVNEQQQLISMHTLFASEHNRLADEIGSANPDWSGERIYQEARALVGGQIQAVTYNEWLPKLLGEEALGSYAGYDADLNASVTNEFSTCAFRFCHSMIPEELERLAENGDPIAQGHIDLKDGFFNPDEFREAGGMDPLLRGLAATDAMAVDNEFSESIRSFLDAGDGEESDLLARNVMRGRDHGLADYNLLRAAYGLDPIGSWEELTDDPVLLAELRRLYGDTPEGLDPYIGGLLELAGTDALVGELNWSIIADQFTRLRDGDRFWYENLFGAGVIDWLNERSLADIIRDNTGISWMQDDVFITAARVSAPGMFALLILAMIGMRRRQVILSS